MKKTVKKESLAKRRQPARGVLWLIALMLLISGIVRLSGETGQAIAREVSQLANGDDEPGLELSMGSCPAEEDIALVLARLQEREDRLEEKESAFKDRLQAIAVAEDLLQANMSALVSAEEDLKATMAIANSAAEDDLSRLTSVYENMKPNEASALFEAMDPQFAAGFLGRMRPDAAASVMAGLTPQTAYSISVILAGRNANVPTN
ncbi:MAG TPA: hypothetical protein ENK28_00980 [Aliiroseovarius sp.]|nr:hypothetical protein [Aliiroseovarius sp.]